MSFFSLKHRVREQLVRRPITRDSDNALIALLLLDSGIPNLNKMTAEEFLLRLMGGEYGKMESITRCRRILQEKHADLRGRLWHKRHTYQKEIKNQLKFEFNNG